MLCMMRRSEAAETQGATMTLGRRARAFVDPHSRPIDGCRGVAFTGEGHRRGPWARPLRRSWTQSSMPGPNFNSMSSSWLIHVRAELQLNVPLLAHQPASKCAARNTTIERQVIIPPSCVRVQNIHAREPTADFGRRLDSVALIAFVPLPPPLQCLRRLPRLLFLTRHCRLPDHPDISDHR
jgi:hypothetical protein